MMNTLPTKIPMKMELTTENKGKFVSDQLENFVDALIKKVNIRDFDFTEGEIKIIVHNKKSFRVGIFAKIDGKKYKRIKTLILNP
jgi:hypothetical protein